MLTVACLLALVGQITVDGNLDDIRAVAQASQRDPVNEVCAAARSGFDFSNVYVYYAVDTDTVFVGLDLMDIPDPHGIPGSPVWGLPGLGVPGDADGDGDPDSPATNPICVAAPFVDEDGVGPDEFYWVMLDPNNGGGLRSTILAQYRNNRFDIGTYPDRTPIPGASGAIALGTIGASHHPTQIPDENPSTADIEMRIDHWSRYDSTPANFSVVAIGAFYGLPSDSTNAVLVDIGSHSCASGAVNESSGTTDRVLRINGNDTVSVAALSTPIDVSLDVSLDGPNPARYVLWIWAGSLVDSFDVNARGTALGCTVGATPLRRFEQPQPFRCLRSPDLPSRVCGSLAEPNAPPRAPWSITRRRGFSVPITLTLQGILEDEGASNPIGFSVTNAVVVEVQ
ncbi:MAG: hypothetical protein HYR85_20535 [Planctomycetes bacterium]|nr:hypothetical protein [Planctomycetota bacterium]MBI3845682.1 hypothetical protein [Planctomycetota bacterium]